VLTLSINQLTVNFVASLSPVLNTYKSLDGYSLSIIVVFGIGRFVTLLASLLGSNFPLFSSALHEIKE
jgi:hypothetical protein